ncbi:MAG: PEP-CTERM sorting domain-containing protein [Phycisphaerales bacterium JB052]
MLSLGPPAWAGVIPPDAYNAATSTSGAFTGDDSLYAGNPGYFSSKIGTGSTIISHKKIVVTETSQFWGVTGNGTSASGTDPSALDWEITIDPFDGSIATSDPTNGQLFDEALTVSDSILRGSGFIGGTSEDWDVMLNPTDGDGFILGPGEYYVAVWADSSPFTNYWLWNELSTSGVDSDIFWGDFRHAPGEFDPILGENTLGGQTMQTGDLGFDVWMTPVPAPGTAALLGIGAPFAFRRRRR